jgi:formyl-CoA transferase
MALRAKKLRAEATGPLEGTRVLDLSRLFAGNVMTQLLGDYGAEVIKVEPPAGDTLRAWQTKGVSTHWKSTRATRRACASSCASPRRASILLSLVPSAALFVESFRPGTLEAWASARRSCSRRIRSWWWCASRLGQDGPYRRRPGSAR